MTFEEQVAAIERDFWYRSGNLDFDPIRYWVTPTPPTASEPDPSTEDTGDVTPEPPKPVVNPFYPKGREW